MLTLATRFSTLPTRSPPLRPDTPRYPVSPLMCPESHLAVVDCDGMRTFYIVREKLTVSLMSTLNHSLTTHALTRHASPTLTTRTHARSLTHPATSHRTRHATCASSPYPALPHPRPALAPTLPLIHATPYFRPARLSRTLPHLRSPTLTYAHLPSRSYHAPTIA